MLLQFVVENFGSFRDKAVLSLAAAGGVEHAEHQLVEDDVAATPQLRFAEVAARAPVLRCAAVYGANASGKSNLVKALAFARRLVVLGTKSDHLIRVSPFKLSQASRSAPSRFEFEIAIGGVHYSYGFIANDRFIEEEWLFANDGTGEQALFERTWSPTHGAPTIILGDKLAKDPSRRAFLGFVAEGTRRNQLFLTEARERNVSEIEPVARWFKQGLRISTAALVPQNLIRRLERSPSLARFVAAILRASGTGVSDIRIDRLPPLDRSQLEKLEPSRLNDLLQFHVQDGTRASIKTASGTVDVRLQLQHDSSGGPSVPFALDQESAGTLRLVALAVLLYDLRRSAQVARTVVIDELERSLHPLLTRSVLQAFLESPPSKRCGQLLFTTHDTNLLDLNLLPRDSIWFTEKDTAGATSLYSLAEFKDEQLARLGNHLEKGYLQGRFGAIPFLGDPAKLGWTRSAVE